MHIKRFEAATLEQALARVKAELGPEALILSSRTVRPARGAFGLLSRPSVEIQAALERGHRELGAETSDAHRDARMGSGEREPVRPGEGGEPGDGLPRELIEDLRRELARSREHSRFQEEIRSELRGLRRLVEAGNRFDAAQQRDQHAEALVRAGLDCGHALSIVGQWQDGREQGDPTPLGGWLKRRIEQTLTPPRVDRAAGPRILVGAAGVGKTTTLAKLAARNEEGERDVALVSLDGYRVGAQAQLRGYAELMETPYLEATSAAELPAIVSRFSRHAVMIDTAGRSRNGEDRLEPLLALRRALGKRASIELVVDATARREVQRAQLDRFSALEPDRLILSRVDECESLLEVTNLLLDRETPPVCWLATGQRVPEDLIVAEPELFVRELMEEAA